MGFSNLEQPLRELAKSDGQLKLDPAALKAFADLKHALTHAPTLAIVDPDLPFELVCDASGFGCGAVLLQENRPLEF